MRFSFQNQSFHKPHVYVNETLYPQTTSGHCCDITKERQQSRTNSRENLRDKCAKDRSQELHNYFELGAKEGKPVVIDIILTKHKNFLSDVVLVPPEYLQNL